MNNEQQSAYPVALPHPNADYAKGLTKLEAFTMAAMQGLCANAHIWNNAYHNDIDIDTWIAVRSLQIAKDTLLELEKQPKGKGVAVDARVDGKDFEQK